MAVSLYFPSLPARNLAQMGDVDDNPVHLTAEEINGVGLKVAFLWGRSSGTSGEHPLGLALDHSGLAYGGGVSNPGPMDRQLCIDIVDRLWRNRRRVGLWYAIWDRKISSTNRNSYAFNSSDDFWAGADYRGSNPHTDHVHTSYYAANVYQPPANVPEPPEEDDMFTDADRANLQLLTRVLAANNDAKVSLPHSDNRVSVRDAVRRTHNDTWALNDRRVKKPWEFSDEAEWRWRTFAWASYGQARRAAGRSQENGNKLDQVLLNQAAIMAAWEGQDTDAIKATVNARAAELATALDEASEQIDGLGTRLDEALGEIGAVHELLEEHASGGLDAAAVVEGIRDLFHRGTAPTQASEEDEEEPT